MITKKRKFHGFGVVTRQGRFLGRYSRTSIDETREAYERHNPQVEGHEDGYSIVKETRIIEPTE